MRDAVALLADGRTALALAGRAGLRAGETVLVEAAAGGVGTLLVQIARNAGARVVALAGQPRKLALARDLGADLTVDYSRDGWERQVRDAAGQVDVVFDGVGGDIGLAAFGLLGAGGRFCPFGMASGSFAPVTPELAQAWRVTVRAGAAASPGGTGGAGPDGPGRGRRGPPAAGRRPGIRAGRGRRRARGHRGQDDGRQDAADGARGDGEAGCRGRVPRDTACVRSRQPVVRLTIARIRYQFVMLSGSAYLHGGIWARSDRLTAATPTSQISPRSADSG